MIQEPVLAPGAPVRLHSDIANDPMIVEHQRKALTHDSKLPPEVLKYLRPLGSRVLVELPPPISEPVTLPNQLIVQVPTVKQPPRTHGTLVACGARAYLDEQIGCTAWFEFAKGKIVGAEGREFLVLEKEELTLLQRSALHPLYVLWDNVLVKVKKVVEEQRPSGLILPAGVAQRQGSAVEEGEVIAYGDGKLNKKGTAWIPMPDLTKKHVWFEWASGSPYTIDGVEYRCVSLDQVLAVVEE